MKLSVIMILAFSSLLANAQAGRDKDDFLVSFMGDYTNVDGYISHQGGGINLEVMIGRYVGLQTAFAGNKDYAYFKGNGSKIIHFHNPAVNLQICVFDQTTLTDTTVVYQDFDTTENLNRSLRR